MKTCCLLLLFLFPVLIFGQAQVQDSATLQQKDTAKSGTGKDTLFLIDTLVPKKDSANQPTAIVPAGDGYGLLMQRAMASSHYLNSSGLPVAKLIVDRKYPQLDIVFYLLLGVVLFLSFLRFFSERYFNNLFRVFFNTSLRQSQLTDQLLQAKQVSLLFNLLFVITGGLYVYFLLRHFNWVSNNHILTNIGICTGVVAIIYFVKYLSLKFTGWLTGFKTAANTYLFIIFLINKILGILLIPFVVMIAFAAGFLQYPAVLVSLLMIALMFLLRFIRSYSLLRREIKVSRFHFFIYIAGVEIMPLLLIYKSLVVLFGKNN